MPPHPDIAILVVNDQPDTLHALAETLRPLGVQVLTATSARDGLRLARGHELAVALVDIRMPGTDGFAMVAQLRADPAMKGLPVIFVSAVEPTAHTRESVYALGGADFVPLPAPASELRSKVSVFVELHRQKRELSERALAISRQADRDVRDQQERFRMFMEAACDYAIFFTNPTGEITEWPAGAETMFGYTAEEAVGQHTALIFTAEDRAAGLPEQEIAEATQSGQARDERWHRRKSGEAFFAIGRLVALRDAGKIRGFAKILRDATEAKRAEAELRQALDRFAALADSMAQMAWMADSSGSCLWFNRQWFDYTGTAMEQMLGWGFATVFHPDERDEILTVIQRNSAAGVRWHASWRIRAADQSYRWFLIQAAPIHDEQGNLSRWFGTNTDVHQHVLVQQQLKASEEKFREIFETAHEGIWLIDANARVELVNSRMSDILGYRRDEILGRQKLDFAFPEDVDFVRRLFEERRRGAASIVEVRFRRKDGEPVWTLLSGRPLFREGKFAGALDMFTDISARKQATERFERELKAEVAQRTNALEEKTRQLESFAYTIAHDLRSPLRAISGYAEFALEDFKDQLPSGAIDHLQRIQASAARLDALIHDLLSYARVSQVEFVEQDVPLSAAVKWSLEQLRSEIQVRTAKVEVSPQLPSVRGERTIIDQVVLNLLSNALKFVAPDVTPEVSVFADSQDGRVRLSIRDNGVGIPREYHARIFRVFERLQGPHRVPGTGVGLAIVARAAERLGGRAGLESEPGRGSTFWVEFRQGTS